MLRRAFAWRRLGPFNLGPFNGEYMLHIDVVGRLTSNEVQQSGYALVLLDEENRGQPFPIGSSRWAGL